VSAAAPPPADPAAALRALTQRRFEANAKSDRAFYERLLAPHFVLLLPGRPPQSKRAYLDEEFGTRPAGYRGALASVTDLEVRVDGDTAVVTYTAAEPTPLGDQSFTSRTRRLDTYVRVRGEWRLVAMAVQEVPSWPEVAAVDPRLYAEYAGTYRFSSDQSIVVTVEDGHLMAQATGQQKTEMFPENATTFFDTTDSPGARTVFERDASGAVVAQVYRSQGQKVRAVKVDVVPPAPEAGSLVGSWRLVSYEDKPPKGPSVFPFGIRPQGLLTYDATGHMALQIMKVPHPKVASGDDAKMTPAEKQDLLDAYVAYFGRYRVDAARSVVVHQVDGDLYDVFVGRDEERPFTLTGDRLELTPTWKQDGQQWTGVRVFERVR
jgi:hypothetical protein